MNKFTKIIICLLCVALSACVKVDNRSAAYFAKLDSLVGGSEAELVSAMGAPESFYSFSETEKILIYKTAHTSIKKTRDYGTFGGEILAEELKCETTFTLKNGTVTHWKAKGNYCLLN